MDISRKYLSFVKLTVCVLVFSSAYSQGIDFREGSWEEVRKEAREQEKIVFVDAYATWCGPCKKMAKNVFTDEQVGEFYNANFINYKLDMEKGEGIAFAREYNVRAYPTLLFINGNGDMLHQSLGALEVDDFIELGKDALDPSTQIAVLKYQYDKGKRDAEFLRTYLKQTLKAGYPPGDIAESYFEQLDEDALVSAENFRLIRMLRPSMDHILFELVLQNKKAFEEVVVKEDLNAFIAETCKWDLLRTAYKGTEEEFNHKLLIIKNLDIENDEEIIAFGELYATQRTNNQEDYLKALRQYYDYAENDWNTLNTLAWEIYEKDQYTNVKLIKFALKMAKRSIEIDRNYYNTDTYAALLYKLGDYKDARKWAEIAISLAKSANMDYSETRELIRKLDTVEK